MKKIKSFIMTGKQAETVKKISGKFNAMLMGKEFQPMPSYWALVPVKQVTNMNKIERQAFKNPADQ